MNLLRRRTADPYDADLVVALVEDLVEGRGAVDVRDVDEQRVLVLTPTPDSPGSPIVVVVDGNRAVVTVGLGARWIFVKDEEEDEDEDEELVVEVVAAVMNGRAEQYAVLCYAGEPFHVRLSIAGRFGVMAHDLAGAIPLGPIPGWD